MSERVLESPFLGIDAEKWLIKQAQPQIKKKLGADYDPLALIRLLQLVCKAGKLRNPELTGTGLTDTEVLDLAEMFIFMMDHTLHWKIGSKIFRHYLNDGGQNATEIFEPNTYLLAVDTFRSEACVAQWTKAERAIQARIDAPEGTLFPRNKETGEPQPSEVTDHSGNKIRIEPAPSPLRAGGTETIYIETSVRITPDGESELAAVFNRIGVVSKVTVRSTPIGDGSWEIEFLDWSTWAWDKCDFNPSGEADIQFLPIGVDTFFPPWLRDKVISILERQFEIAGQCLDQLIGFDMFMRQLVGKEFQRINITTGQPVHYAPRVFYARFAPWDFFTQTGSCGVKRKYVVKSSSSP
jgi:hypothetical protein